METQRERTSEQVKFTSCKGQAPSEGGCETIDWFKTRL
jgi:hypothetical protein